MVDLIDRLEELRQQRGRRLTLSEASDELGVSQRDLRSVLQRARRGGDQRAYLKMASQAGKNFHASEESSKGSSLLPEQERRAAIAAADHVLRVRGTPCPDCSGEFEHENCSIAMAELLDYLDELGLNPNRLEEDSA